MQVPRTLGQLGLKTPRQYSSVSLRVEERLRRVFRSLDRPDSFWTRFWITIDLIVIQCDSPTLLRAIRPLYRVRVRRIHRRRLFELVSRGYGRRYAAERMSSFLETSPNRLCWELVKQSRRCAKDLLEHTQASQVRVSLQRFIRLHAYATVIHSRHLSVMSVSS